MKNYVFDNVYTLNSTTYRDIGQVYAVYNQTTREFMGYRAVSKKLKNDQEICSASFPCDPEELTVEEIIHAFNQKIIIE